MMKTSTLLVFGTILVFTAAVELTKDGLNILTKESIDFTLENNSTVLAVWNSPNCMDCQREMWNVYKAIYSFLDEPKFFVMAATIGMDKELDAKYKIDSSAGGTFYRLFLEGNPTPILKEEGDEFGEVSLESWVSKTTHFAPQDDCVTELSADSYNSFFKKNSFRSVMMMYYHPSSQSSQLTVVQFYRAALAFQIEAKAVFARMDCSMNVNFCKSKELNEFPSIQFYPGKDVEFDGKQIETRRGEGIVRYLNEKLDTNVSPKGGFDEQFGRHPELDRLAHLFTMNQNTAQRKRYMKETAKLRKRYRSTAKYYLLMKKIMEEGTPAILRELSGLNKAMKDLKFTDPEYPKYRMRENIVHQFEMLNTRGEMVHLNPWNFDYIVNGQNDVVVLFHTPWCDTCSSLLTEMAEVVKYRTDDIIFATLDAQKYVDFCAPFHLNHFPTFKFFKAGGDIQKPDEIPGSTRGDVEKYLRQVMSETEL